ncbi:hypothetical protein GCM10027355_10350 [Haloplanus salinarum]
MDSIDLDEIVCIQKKSRNFSRQKDDKANPPGYRKHGDERPRSTVTFKEDGFKHDSENNRVRLSKGSNLKKHFSDFLLCEYQTRPDVDLSVQNVRTVWNDDEWELHFVCKYNIYLGRMHKFDF